MIGHRNQKLISIKRRPFEILAGTFVLSYFDDADTDAVIDSTHDLKIFHKERKRLNRLVQRDICLPVLHGPGGSGKTTVVDLVGTSVDGELDEGQTFFRIGLLNYIITLHSISFQP